MIVFSSTFNSDDVRIKLEFDEHVPFSVTTREGLLGAKYLRLGDFERNLLEIMLDPISFAVRGLTLVCFDSLHVPAVLPQLAEQVGLPVLDLNGSQLSELLERPWAELNVNFTLGISTDFAELDLYGIANADNVTRSDRLEFYCRGNVLLGIRLNHLTSDEVSALQSHASLIE
jgi:hypothetical protein